MATHHSQESPDVQTSSIFGEHEIRCSRCDVLIYVKDWAPPDEIDDEMMCAHCQWVVIAPVIERYHLLESMDPTIYPRGAADSG